MQRRDLARKHLDRRLKRFRPVEDLAPPPKGWVRAIRDALGMTAAQLAARLGVKPPRIVALEQAEQRGAVTLETLRRAAHALDSTLVYALVPNSSLDAIVQQQARKVAEERVARVDHSMRLENQGLSPKDIAVERERVAGELLRGNLRRMWDVK